LNGILKVKQKLVELVMQATEQAQQTGKLPSVVLPEVIIERPQKAGHGDYATSLPLKLARACGKNPIVIAQTLAELIPSIPEIASITVAPPGFINFTFRNEWLSQQVENIIAAGQDYGNINLGEGQSVQVEFVSANPTGPLHVGHGRGAVLGSTLANVLQATNYVVQREYYVNDAGSQMNAFYRSLWARYQQALGHDVDMPKEGYFGQYMIDLARDIVNEYADKFLNQTENEAMTALGKVGLTRMLSLIRRDLELLRVNYDCWFSEQSLYEGMQFDKVMQTLKHDNHLELKEGATWFVSTALGEDKDNVVIRSDGTATYFATDIAYHYNKFIERGLGKVIDIWGADHQGHVSRMKAVMSALGLDPVRLHVIISQLVTLRRGGQSVRVSKRSGDMITLRELIDEVGVDACRFFFLARSADSQMDFDLELAKKESSENPVYYVQYAHARICSILRMADEEGVISNACDIKLLGDEAELSLIRQMLRLQEIVEIVSRTLEPQHLPYYAQELAAAFHGFYKQCRVISKDNLPLSNARLKLLAAARLVLARTLNLMGMSAPETM
jgi:arginyl-tRNA synthetase